MPASADKGAMRSVSVVVPVHDRPAAAVRAIASALAQGEAVHEIIVVDDASRPPFADTTRNDAALIVLGDPRVRVVTLRTNRGAAGARQAGVDAASGDILAFLDSDDVWMPGKLAAQVPLVDGLDAVACGWRETTGDEVSCIRMPIAADDRASFFAGCWFCPGSTVVVSRDAFARVGPFATDLRRLEDLEWFIRFGLAGGRLVVAPVIGAEIAIGGRARIAPVEKAAAAIRAMVAGRNDVTSRERRALEAYLQLELAKAAANERRSGLCALALLKSFQAVPRTSLHLRQWWTALDRSIDG